MGRESLAPSFHPLRFGHRRTTVLQGRGGEQKPAGAWSRCAHVD
jgi:hypothetical protein